MSVMKYTEDHEWVRVEDDSANVGITDYAQEQLGEVVFVELPTVGNDVAQGDEVAVIESVKAAGEIKSPISGKITVVNDALDNDPGKINTEPTGDGWIYKLTVSDAGELDALMDEAAYQTFIDGLD